MKKLILFILLFLLSFFTENSSSQILFEENFDYPAGDSIGAHGWTWNTGTTNNIMVVSPGLTFPTYPLSGIGNSCRLRNNGFDAYKPMTVADSLGNLYTSFMVNIDSSQANGGDYFFALLPSNSTSIYIARFFVKDTTGGICFGVSKGAISTSNPVNWTSGVYQKHSVYVIVVKYTFNSGSTQDDEIKVYVFSSSIPGTEPGTPTIGPVTGTSTDPTNLGRVAIRQGSASVAPTLNIDGIRVSKTWAGVVPVSNLSKVADVFSLKQNYPNPFNPSTTIGFSIPKESFVTLKVYDALGSEIEQLVNENLNRGQYNVKFDASDYSSGVYFYKITSTEAGTNEIQTDVKSMILIK